MFMSKIYTFVLCICAVVLKTLAYSKCTLLDVRVTGNQTTACSTTEYCDEQTLTCQCNLGFKRINGTCVVDDGIQPDSTPNYSSLVDNHRNGPLIAGVLIPIFLIVLIISSIYLNKRFEVVKWLRRKIYQRNENYDEFMIGQDLEDDDPPLR